VTNGYVKEETTEIIKNAEKFYKLVRYVLWKWEMLKAYLEVGVCPY
jgi:hypothetical protein